VARPGVPEEVGDPGRSDHKTSGTKPRPHRADENLELTLQNVEGIGMLSVKVGVVALTRFHDTLKQSELVAISSEHVGGSAELFPFS
jgi:hypothetical protein